MKKITLISFLFILSVLTFVSTADTKRIVSAPVDVADLSVAMVDTPEPVNTGATLTYTITVNNNGPDSAASASWSDTLPAGTTFVSLPGVAGWSCTTPDPGDVGTVSCSNPSFAVGSAVFTLVVQVAPSVAAGTVLSNTATVTSSTPEGNSGNESGTATTTVRSPANVTGTKSRSGGTSPGATVEYLIILSNSTSSPQQDNPGDEFTDVLPAGLTLVSAAASSGSATATIATNTVTWNGIVPAGDSVTITIAATINNGTEDQTISNQGSISYDADGNGTNEATHLTNTDGFVVTAPVASADLGVNKVASADTVVPDSDVTYTITIANGGPDLAASVALNDTLPGTMTFVSLSSPGGWSCTTPSVGAGGLVNCTNPSLTVANGAQIFTLVGHIPAGTGDGTSFINTASVSTTTNDPNSENNSSVAGTTAVTCLTNPVVTTSADSGAGSLRRAIQDACVGGIITFDMTQVVSPITLTSAELLINKDLTIQGPGANLLTVMRSTADATPSFRIFNVASGAVNISGLTISNGNGGGGFGGGILYGSSSTVTVTNSTISGNSAAGGAGIGNSSGGTLNVTNSTISNNPAGNLGGGGIFSGSGVLNVTNSTISGNSASDGGGGGINSGGTATIANSTISNNSTTGGADGGGIRNNGTVNLRNSIIAGNTASSGGPDFSGTLNSQDYNLIGNTSGATISGTTTHNITNQSANLGALANNGGPTQTMLPVPGSPAINAGDPANLPPDSFDLDGDSNTTEPLPVDQRGFARVVGANFDIGAVETNYAITATAGTPQSATVNTAFATAFKVNVTESGTAQSGVSVTFTAPGSGASGTFPGPSATAVVATNSSGDATAPTFTANAIGGTYNVIAAIGSGLPTATFVLTNIPKAATSTVVSSSVNPSNVGQSVTFTATVTSTAGTPTGTVQFKDGGTDLGPPQSLSGGVATFSTTALTVGVHTITADYSGDLNFLGSTGTLPGGQQVGSIIRFSSATYDTTEGSGFTTITVQRIGDLSQAVSVDYTTPDDSSALTILPCSTANGVASPRCDFNTAIGTLRFAAGDGASKTFTVLINQDRFVEGPETLTLTLSNLTGGAGFSTPGATTSTATLSIADDVTEPATNPIDDTETFVRQQYRDFLNREADPAGLAFWIDNIDKCNDPARRPANLTVAQCIETLRVQTSAAFYLSIEFQQSGYYVYRMFKTGFDDIAPPTVPVPIRYSQFIRDTAEVNRGVIVGQGNWEAQLNQNKQAFALSFVQRPEFLSRYPALTSATAFVNLLDENAGGVLSDSERSALISELSPNPTDPALRASVLRKVADNAVLVQQQSNRAFVLMQYFGYLRRNPDAAPDSNFDGYNFWLNKLNTFNGDFVKAEMVKAFLSSIEYRGRFGP